MVQELVEKKITQKQAKIDRQKSELDDAKSMTYETIVQNISSAKKARSCIQQDINGLVDKREEQDSLISKLNRIMLQKKKLAGA